MRFTQDPSSSRNLIRSYAPGEIKINDEVFHHALIVGPASIAAGPAVSNAGELTADHTAQIVALAPAGIGFEVMDTGAACRTFNVLVTEQRRVVALLLV